MIIDADGLFLVQENIKDIINLDRQLILTPNKPEFERLKKSSIDNNLITDWSGSDEKDVTEMAKVIKCTIILKGEQDIIADSNGSYIINKELGSNRRCGGQGDLLAGIIGEDFD